ncbi:leucine-rich repeat domain-containing protein [Ruminococcus sp. AF18-22]|nr:leucine-rich repeat domain-containing protein [Ruminococcus sp. AF18-22]
MKIQYRIQNQEIEVVRCFGTDSKIWVPAAIEGMPVTKIAAYAFSARKDKEEEDVLLYETKGVLAFVEEQRVLAGEEVEEVRLPDTLREIGNYIFYGCKNLRTLAFSDSLTQIGSGAFTGCSGLSKLHVHMLTGDKSCVKEILGDLWQRIDVVFSYIDGRKIQLVFPEHYEEAVENTPARILFTQHHGSGNNYRQCFYDKEVDCRKYDELFSVAKAQDKIPVLTDLVFSRLCYPAELTESARQSYEQFVRDRQEEILMYLVEAEKIEELREMSGRRLWTKEGLERGIESAAGGQKAEIMSFLMQERHKAFPAKRKKFML